MKTFSLLLTLALLTLSAPTFAEDNSFFEKDFAKVPGRDSSQEPPGIAWPPLQVAPTPNTPIATSEPAESTDLSARVKAIANKAKKQEVGSEIIQSTPLPGSKQSMTVSLVGAILDATKQELVAKQLDDMLALLANSKILISTIYCIGPRIEISSKTRYAITKQFGRILFVDQAPEKYRAVKKSPTWILSSLDQEIVLEGVGLLSQNLNTKGEITTQATDKVKAASDDKRPPVTGESQ